MLYAVDKNATCRSHAVAPNTTTGSMPRLSNAYCPDMPMLMEVESTAPLVTMCCSACFDCWRRRHNQTTVVRITSAAKIAATTMPTVTGRDKPSLEEAEDLLKPSPLPAAAALLPVLEEIVDGQVAAVQSREDVGVKFGSQLVEAEADPSAYRHSTGLVCVPAVPQATPNSCPSCPGTKLAGWDTAELKGMSR